MEIREEIAKKRGYLCEFCQKRAWSDLHHCIVHDSVRYHKEVTVEENLMAVCRVCHPYLNGHDTRVRFALKQLERGYDIITWYMNLPIKVREDWIINLKKES